MIESKFRHSAVLGIITCLLLLVLLTSALLIFILTRPGNTLIYLSIGLCPLVIILVWLTWGEIRTKAIKLIIKPDKLTINSFFGLGALKTISPSEIDGYKISILPSEYKNYEYLYLMVGKRKRIKISQFYHQNYAELKKEIAKKFRNLGVEEFSFLRELKEAFQ